MSRTRSRPKTEEKFQNAVLQLVADKGCGALGINAVAQLAGADKVLIYRYFNDFEGLLQQVAHSRSWLPTTEQVLETVHGRDGSTPLSLLQKIERTLLEHIRTDACLHQLVRWRRTDLCPLCRALTVDWHTLWKTIPQRLSQKLPYAEQALWSQACQLLALSIEAELCDEPIDSQCLAVIASYLPRIEIEGEPEPAYIEDSLPTNLL